MTCKVCMSIHRQEYERLKLEKHMTNVAISKYAKEKYNEDIPHWTFAYHFKAHCQPYIESLVKSSRYRKEVVRAQIKKDIVIARQLTKNLEICADKIREKLHKGELTKDEEKLLLDYLAETRLTIEELLRWSEKLKLEEEEPTTLERIVNCMKDFPPEYIELFLKRWEEHEER